MQLSLNVYTVTERYTPAIVTDCVLCSIYINLDSHLVISEMCSERDSPLEPFVLPAPGQPELARLTCGAHLGPPELTRKQKRPRVNSLVCDRAAALCTAGPPEVLSRMSRPVTQAAERERELARARSQRLKQAAPNLPGESVSRGFADRGALEGYPSHYTSLVICMKRD